MYFRKTISMKKESCEGILRLMARETGKGITANFSDTANMLIEKALKKELKRK
jgi:hypothetical protein